MWKIWIKYCDRTNLTLTGSHKDIPLRLARKYYNMYVAGHVCKNVIYQQYPKSKHKEMDLIEKIEELEDC